MAVLHVPRLRGSGSHYDVHHTLVRIAAPRDLATRERELTGDEVELGRSQLGLGPVGITLLAVKITPSVVREPPAFSASPWSVVGTRDELVVWC